ncbi:hypothetical protein G3I59_06515 [Amycolatopsis rubida]|uniref:Uncharacterized protein n=1 Tax=Amycolatopsis rubida TaxID=112413 RepID=A0A1I5KP60_9PSEU|nr:hypothetical protein [Amycolatopsis rubida]MYW90280.1 hypothetical protein [Amycolatopsis rubida]NEC55257.1 hypothetical protein [Amycolatopsis rubida]SFO86331.1 hypothetical protein SAMN05421854_103267 [Amycolatopsis rubida]
MRGTRRLALAGCGIAAGLLVAAPIASAGTQAPAPAPVTLSPQEVQQMCTAWVPKLRKQAQNLTNRINGGPEVSGSVANLKARANDARTKGHTAQADRLQKRADKRQGRIGELANATKQLDAFTAAHCQAPK